MHIDTKILNGEIEKELSCILNKKKDILNEEIERYLKRVKDQIYYYEETIKKELQEKMEKLEGELKSIMTIDPRIEQDFNAWTSKAEGKIHQL
jgi:archaellum component FlaC